MWLAKHHLGAASINTNPGGTKATLTLMATMPDSGRVHIDPHER
jgi:hypothetical protein